MIHVSEVFSDSPTIIPSTLHTDGYRYLFGNAEIGTWFVNSTIVSAVCVAEKLTTFTSTKTAFLPASSTCCSLISCLPFG